MKFALYSRQILIRLVFLWIGMHTITPPSSAQEIQHRSFYASALQREWRYSIYVPEAIKHDLNQVYPVVFMLHGMYNTNKTFANRGFAKILNQLIAEEKIDPIIVVFPNGYKQSWWVNSDAFGAIEAAFFEDLLPHVAQNYPISDHPSQRVIAGISMGGFGAINYAFHPSNTFGHLVLFSPALFLASPLNTDTHPLAHKTNWRHNIVLKNTIEHRAFAFGKQEQPFNAILFIPKTYPYLHEQNPERLHQLSIQLYYGDEDPITDSGTRFFHDFLEEKMISFSAHITPRAGHEWSLWRKDFMLALEKIFSSKNT